jgi:aminoglycoside phosphotransferase (APT) family kinase protein
MNASVFENYLKYRLPETVDLKVISFKQSFPGLSRETWFVNTTMKRDGKLIEQGYIFRMDTPGGSVCHIPLYFEYSVYNKLQNSKVPVPVTLWFENDPEWLIDGREFFVRETVDGRVLIPELKDPDPKYDSLREKMTLEMAEKLALLHTCDWKALGFDEIMQVPESKKDCVRLDLDFWQKRIEKYVPEPSPLVDRIMIWLRENQPGESSAIALLKGNNGIGEEIWQGEKIVAMCDWEYAHLGDPSEDFSWCQVFRDDPHLMPMLIDHYKEVSGINPSVQDIEYFKIFRDLKTFVSLQMGLNLFNSGKDYRMQLPNMALWSRQIIYKLADNIGI